MRDALMGMWIKAYVCLAGKATYWATMSYSTPSSTYVRSLAQTNLMMILRVTDMFRKGYVGHDYAK